MNYYLRNMACNLPEIRNLLGWTQQHLADALQITRAVVNGFENDPSRFSQVYALAIYTLVVGDIERRKWICDNDYVDWNKAHMWEEHLGSIVQTLTKQRLLLYLGKLERNLATINKKRPIEFSFHQPSVRDLISQVYAFKSKTPKSIPEYIDPIQIKYCFEHCYKQYESDVMQLLELRNINTQDFLHRLNEPDYDAE